MESRGLHYNKILYKSRISASLLAKPNFFRNSFLSAGDLRRAQTFAWTTVSATVVTMRMCRAVILSCSLRMILDQRATSMLVPAAVHAKQPTMADLIPLHEHAAQIRLASNSLSSRSPGAPTVGDQLLGPGPPLTVRTAQGWACSQLITCGLGRSRPRLWHTSSRLSLQTLTGRLLRRLNSRRRQLTGGSFSQSRWNSWVRPSRSWSGQISGWPATTSSLNSFSTARKEKS